MSKKWIFMLSLVMVVSLLAACGNNSGNTGKNAEQPAAAGKDGNKYVMRLGHTLSETSARHVTMQAFKEKVEQETGGNLVVELYHSNSLGDNNQLLQAVPLGMIEGAVQPTSFFGGVEKKLSVLDLPFIFEDMRHIERFVLSAASEELLKLLEQKDMKGLALWPLGIQQLTSSKPIGSAEELKGQKFRTMGTPIQLDLFTKWGTNPTAIPLTELYSSLQQGVIDGQSNDIGTIHDVKLYEVQKHVLMTNHGATVDLLYVNKNWFDSLPADYQEVLLTAAKDMASVKTQEEMKEIDSKLKAIEATQKVIISNPSAEMLEWMRGQADLVIESFRAEYPDMVPVLEAILNN